MKTLLGNDITKGVQKVEVTGFSNGSVVVDFKVIILTKKSKEEIQSLLTKLLHDEMGKESGQFHEYLSNVGAPRVIFMPEGAATTSTSKPTTTMTSTVRTTPTRTPIVLTRTATTTNLPPATTTTKAKPPPTTTKITKPPPTTTTATTTTTTKTKLLSTTTKTNKPPPTTTTATTTTSTTKTKSPPMTTTIKLPGPTYCQIHAPCQNGGTCVDLAGDSYVCVCPKCNCSRVEPFGDCVVDMDTICRKEDLPPHNIVPHPYNCKKYVKCTSDGRATTVGYVWRHENGSHVFNPETDLSDFISNVPCAREIVKRTLCANVTCINGGTCEDTHSGFKCHCMSGYMGSKCQTRV
ncbi:hypothetical protein LSAT2_006017 [Lamellibrachia satsuma]|nr:hypothetical protein LSAT2_006017 [Lamellibrachia satsuma]